MVFKEIQISLICLLALQNKALGGRGEVDVTKEFPGPLEEGVSVNISGFVWAWAWDNTFQINFHTDKLWEEDVYFNMRVICNQKLDSVAFNTWKPGEGDAGHWEEEERHHDLPELSKNGIFSQSGLAIRIIAKEDPFYINMNGKEYTFKYRMPKEELKKVKLLAIEGQYTVKSVIWEREIGDNEYKPYE